MHLLFHIVFTTVFDWTCGSEILIMLSEELANFLNKKAERKIRLNSDLVQVFTWKREDYTNKLTVMTNTEYNFFQMMLMVYRKRTYH